MKATDTIKRLEENLIRIGEKTDTDISNIKIALYLNNWYESSFRMLSNINSEIYFKWQQKAIS